ncbi:MAG: type II toxin-antitoxin system VapC family toxin [Candidatus Bathyarchaeia archaeon]
MTKAQRKRCVQSHIRGDSSRILERDILPIQPRQRTLKNKLEKAEAELIRFEILPYTYEIARTAAEIDAQLAKNGQTISFSDTIIAATATHYKLTLVTRNTEHFSRTPNLQIETY